MIAINNFLKFITRQLAPSGFEPNSCYLQIHKPIDVNPAAMHHASYCSSLSSASYTATTGIYRPISSLVTLLTF